MNALKEYGFKTDFSAFPLGELSEIRNKIRFIQETVQLRKLSLKSLNAEGYLSSIESSISSELISPQNYAEIKTLASCLPGAITSFFGFETRLSSSDARADYLFAVSSQRGEREALASLFTNGMLPEAFLQKKEWRNVGRFAAAWADKNSALYQNVLGLWFEFDTASSSEQTPVPSIFLHSVPLRIDTPEDIQKCTWLTQTALPTLIGEKLPEKLEHNIIDSIKKLPGHAVLFDTGVMLSRAAAGVRLVIIRMQPNQIIPYLTSLGWTDENNGLTQLIKELEEVASRIVLHINITENGIDQKIGFECAYHPDQYSLETRWEAFFDYLIEKNACLPEKKALLLDFLGVEQDDSTQEFNLASYQIAPRIKQKDFSAALVRYISHIKVSYKPDHPVEAKAYPGVRLFGQNKTNNGEYYQ